MKILVTAKLSDRGLLHFLSPITMVDDVDEIMVVRDKKGIPHNKIKYYCPPSSWTNIPILAFIYKFVVMLALSYLKKPSLVHGYLLFPHATMAFLVGFLSCRKVGVSLIAGPVELYSRGSPIGLYPYYKPMPPLNWRAKIYTHLLKRMDIITVTGTYTRNFLISIGIDTNKIFILPHIVDERFKNLNINKEYDAIYIGRLAKVKHIEIILLAVKSIIDTYSSFKLAIVGDGECRQKLESISISLGLENNVFFVGYQENVWKWYNKSKLSLLTSEREGFPYSVIESLCCGIPVISSDCGDIRDMVINEYNGIIIRNYKDYGLYTKAILSLLEKEDRYNEYSQNCIISIQDLSTDKIKKIWEYILYGI